MGAPPIAGWRIHDLPRRAHLAHCGVCGNGGAPSLAPATSKSAVECKGMEEQESAVRSQEEAAFLKLSPHGHR